MVNHINVRVYESKFPTFRKRFPFLREINHEFIMVCLRLIKCMVNLMNKTPTTWKMNLRFKFYLNEDETTPNHIFLSLGSLSQEMGWLGCMGYFVKSERREMALIDTPNVRSRIKKIYLFSFFRKHYFKALSWINLAIRVHFYKMGFITVHYLLFLLLF
jgi:hypothetical protein